MTSILALFVTMAMLLSGAGYSADPAAASSRVITIEDIVFTFDGTEYPLAPTIRMGAATEGETALFDFAVPTGDSDLYAFQAQIDETGASVIIGDSPNAYTFSNELMAGLMAESGAEEDLAMMIDSYSELLSQSSATAGMTVSEETIAAVTAFFEAREFTSSEATYTIDGVEYAGSREQLSMSHAEICELLDLLVGDSAYFHSYIDYINSLTILSGDEPVSITNISDLFALTEAELTADFDFTGNETSGTGTITLHITVDGFTMDIPVEIIVYDEDTFEVYAPIQDGESGETVNIYTRIDGADTEISIDMPATEFGDSFGMKMNSTTAEDGTMDATHHYVINSDGLSISLYITQVVSPILTGSGAFELSVTGEEFSFSLSLGMTITDEPIENRVAAAEKIVMNTPEEVEENTGLLLSLMGMLGDTEVLLSDDSVLPLVELFNSMNAELIMDETITEPLDDEYDYADMYWSDGDDDPADLSFTMPDFSALDGFVLSDQYIYADASDSAYLYFDPAEGSDAEGELCIDLIGNPNGTSSFVIAEDGSVSSIDGISVNVIESDSFVNISCLIPGAYLDLYYYGSDISADDLVALLASAL